MAAFARKRTSLAWRDGMVTRRKGEVTARMNEHQCPHIVELAHPDEGFGRALIEAMQLFHEERGIAIRRGAASSPPPQHRGEVIGPEDEAAQILLTDPQPALGHWRPASRVVQLSPDFGQTRHGRHGSLLRILASLCAFPQRPTGPGPNCCKGQPCTPALGLQHMEERR